MSDTGPTHHGTVVACSGRGMLLTGPSGCGKSALALQMIGMGADLVADDRVLLTAEGDRVIARCPPTIEGLIEARGIGVLKAHSMSAAPLAYVVDLANLATERCPDLAYATLVGQKVPLLQRIEGSHFAATLIHILKHGRSTR